MGVIARVDLLLNTTLEAGADGVNGLLRDLQQKFKEQSCLVDYALLGLRLADQKTVTAIEAEAYEEGLAFARRPSEVEGLAAVSTEHLSEAGREWLSGGMEGVLGHSNEYGGFMYTGQWEFDRDGVPAEVRAIGEWAKEQGLVWVKFDADGAVVGCLERFE